MTALLNACLPQSLFGNGSSETFGSDAGFELAETDVRVNREELTALFSDVLAHQDIRRAA